jgi:hypothetical protein
MTQFRRIVCIQVILMAHEKTDDDIVSEDFPDDILLLASFG